MPGGQDNLVPEQSGVKQISTDALVPNPHNPRMLFDPGPMAILQESIRKVGILVPLTVYWSKERNTYVILDGQRRWMCAQKVGQTTVPANVIAEPTLVQNIVTMFQIHKLREDWQLMPTALKLEVLMKALADNREKQLAELTGLDQAVVSRCKKLLSFSRRHQDLMLAAEPKDRVRADFFIELHAITSDKTVRKMSWYERDSFIDRMLEKYQKRDGLKAVTDFRIMKQHISNAVKAKRVGLINRRLEVFYKEDDVSLSFLEIESASARAAARKLLKMTAVLQTTLKAIDPETLYGQEDLWQELEELVKTIGRVLLAAGRRVK